MPGDQLIMECEYNSIGRNNFTYGGVNTYDEMCISFVLVYPRPKLFTCVQMSSLMTTLKAVGLDWTFGDYKPGKTEMEVRKAVEDKKMTLDWNDDEIAKTFEEANRFGTAYEMCMSKSAFLLTDIKDEQYPQFTPFEAEDSECLNKDN